MSSSDSSGSSSGPSQSQHQVSPWGQVLLSYEMERTKPQAKPEPIMQAREIRKLHESSFNPVLGRYNDPTQVFNNLFRIT